MPVALYFTATQTAGLRNPSSDFTNS